MPTSLAGSTFRWYQNGQQLSVQVNSYNSVLQLNSLHSGKVSYPAGSPALDVPAPNETPLAGLGNYYSVQNDYPQVYGIGPGGLPPTASVLRQSQALQFKGYLLFFDQLLADYLAQLSNVRELFTMGASTDGHSYFGGNLGTVPDLDRLLRFPPGPGAGATLLNPVAAKDWDGVMAAGQKIAAARVESLATYMFGSALERDTALATLTVLFGSAQLTVTTIQLDNGLWTYYLTGIPGAYVLVSQSSFTTQDGATGEAQTVLYTGASQYNYSLVSLGEVGEYTFGLVQSGSAYFNYLETILEDPAKYTERRTVFLEHLLARFAETFTDYALLEAGFASETTIADNQVGLMQRFLREWPVLSADRGKAFDYRLDGWNSKNTSGLEKRFKAYCGIADERRHYLCNFEVQRMEERFYLSMRLAGEELFTCTETVGEKEAVPAVFSLFAALADRENYRMVYRSGEAKYYPEAVFRGNLIARGVGGWPDEESARQAADSLCRMWQLGPGKGDSQVSEYQYRPQLLDNQGRIVGTGVAGFINEREALEHGIYSLRAINEEAVWVQDSTTAIGHLCQNLHPQLPPDRFIDVDGYKIYMRQDVLGRGKSSRWSFEVLDEDNSFRFRSMLDFATETAARDACCQLLHFLTETRYYTIKKAPGDWYTLVIRVGDEEWAEGDPGWETEALARERIQLIALQVRQKLYTLRIVSKPYRWKFLFYLGIPGRGTMLFESVDSFETQHASLVAARAFHEAGPGWRRKEEEGAIFLEATGADGVRLICRLTAVSRPVSCAEPLGSTLGYLLEAKEAIYRLAAGDEELAREMVVPDETSKEGGYVYRLVDKDRPLAFHHPARDRAEAEEQRERLIEKGRAGYVYLEICLGGDNVCPGYRYIFRSRNDYFMRTGIGVEEVILFESAMTYADEDAAQAAFQQSYLHILDIARDPENYGEGKYIGSVVRVPAATQDLFRQLGMDVVEELVKATRTYPIRSHKDGYKFVLAGGGHLDWESAIEYPTAAEAHAGFVFFRLLLDFPGNYFLSFDWAACHYRVGIREVLAESTHRYHNEEAAWGPTGVEKFICVAQSTGGIHLNRREDCTYGYFFACPNRKAVHPCAYETAAQRDRALHRLMPEAGHFIADGWIDRPDAYHFRLLDGRGHAVAVVPMPAYDGEVPDRILDIADAIWAGAQPERYGSGLQLVVGEGSDEFAIMPAENWDEAEWMRRLTDLTAYFPVVRVSERGGYSYRLEVKLPGFVDPVVPAPSPKDCGCPPVPEGEPPYCYLAWKSEQRFDGAIDAWEAWLELLPLLADKENYRPVFAEKIGYYGIELHEKKAIIARNPQFYSYAAMAVESVGRARACINAEGLDLVEHLLLRPALSDAEIPVCTTAGPCSSVWTGDVDPYSFIVTIALPAWPERFRKKQNRVMLESILQREMPAHILARVLWLPPRDMCRFEYLYSGWIDALSRGERICAEFKPREFIHWLFDVKHGCLGECRECGHEEEDDAGITARGEEWLDQINRLYCWRDSECAEKWVEPVEVVLIIEEEVIVEEGPRGREEVVRAIEEEIVEELREAVDESRLERAETRPEEPVADPRRIRRIQADRKKRYEQKIAEWRELTGEEKPAEVVGALLMDHNPSMKRLEDVLKEVMEGPRKRGAKALHRRRLAEITLSIYLDRISAPPSLSATPPSLEAYEERWEHLRVTLEKSKVTIENAAAFYTEWRPDEMRQLAAGLDTERIQAVLRERQKGKK